MRRGRRSVEDYHGDELTYAGAEATSKKVRDWHYDSFGYNVIKQVQFLPPPEFKEKKMSERLIRNNCNMCGGGLVQIRGRYPQEPQRRVCPTCLMERMEQIQNIASSGYGQAYAVVDQIQPDLK